MRHLFCVIRVGEPALRGCGTPTLIGPHTRIRPRRRGAARARRGQSRHVRSTHVADRTQHSISGTAPGHSPSSQVGIPQPLTKQRPAIGQHVRIEQLGGRHVVEPCKGHAVGRSSRLEIKALPVRTIQTVVTSSRCLMQRPAVRELLNFCRNTQHREPQTMPQDRDRLVNHHLLRQLDRRRGDNATLYDLSTLFLIEAVLPILQPQEHSRAEHRIDRQAGVSPLEAVVHITSSPVCRFMTAAYSSRKAIGAFLSPEAPYRRFVPMRSALPCSFRAETTHFLTRTPCRHEQRQESH